MDHLVEEIWADRPPATARTQIHSCVSRLRRLFTEAVGLPAGALAREPGGYRLQVPAVQIDAAVFTSGVARARADAAAGLPAEARAVLRRVLRLWRGPVLSGRPAESANARSGIAHLQELRTAALMDCLEIELELGLAHEAVGELTDLVEQFPLNERLRADLMVALHRTGRSADALVVYRAGRTLLHDELGIEPGPELATLHRRVLERDDRLQMPATSHRRVAAGDEGARPPEDGPGRRRGEATPPVVAPCHLPRAVPDFVGRADELRELIAAVPAAHDTATTGPTILTVGGMAGVGKTALAVHLAHRLTPRYPDAQLYIDLHGHSDREPRDLGATVSALLRQLGVAAQRVPEHVDDRVALWRAELARRRVLVVLDNAAGSRQVAPLIPSMSDTLVVVTSRCALAGLDGVHLTSLGVLPASDAGLLLHRIVGHRVAQAPALTAELARLCGHHPLALRLAGARLSHRPNWSVTDLNERLRGAPSRLRELVAEDRAVSAAFDVSYQHLDEAAQGVFRAVGCHPPGTFDRHAAAALADLDPADVDRRLEQLVDVHLLETPAIGRYRLHDLIHDYAAELMAAQPRPQVEAAVRRLSRHYLHATAAATAHYERPVARANLPLGEAPPTVPTFVDIPQAVAWLDADWLNVVAVIGMSDARGDDEHTWCLARALWPYLYRNGHNNELVATHRLALEAAGRRGEAAAATVHNCLAAGYANMNRVDDAERHLRMASDARRRIGDHRGVIRTLNNLALLQLFGAGAPHLAVETCLAGLALAHEIGAAHDAHLCNQMLGIAYRMIGKFDDALTCLERAHAGLEQLGSTESLSIVLGELGGTHAAAGNPAVGLPLLQRAAAMKQAQGNRTGTAEVLIMLGEAYQALGRADEALRCHRDALALVPEGHYVRVAALNGYGRTLLAQGARAEALSAHRQALAHAQQIGGRHGIAQAHEGLAAALGETDPAARPHRLRAAEIYTDMGVSAAIDIRRRVASPARPVQEVG